MDVWYSLPPDLQKLFVGENARRMAKIYGHQFDQDDQMFKGILDKQLKKAGYPGVYVLPEDERARWKKAVKPVWEQWVKKASKQIGEAKARAILEDAIEIAKKYSGEQAAMFINGILDTLRKNAINKKESLRDKKND